jgi:putative serine protease PepD
MHGDAACRLVMWYPRLSGSSQQNFSFGEGESGILESMHEQDSGWRREDAAPSTGSPAYPVTPGPYSAPPAPTTGPPASAPPGYTYPTYQFPAQPAHEPQPAYGTQPQRPAGGGAGGRILLVVIGALVLSLVSGTVGGLIVHSAGGDKAPTQVVTRAAAPQIDRAAVAGVAEKVLPAVVDITTSEGEGSGVVMSADGAIVTNNHVIEGNSGNTVNVTFSDGKTAKAIIVGTDPAGDIAVIKAQNVSGLTTAPFGDSDSMRVGDTVLAIGSPLGLQGSVSQGIISALHRTINEGSESGGGGGKSISDALQTDAAINPGNSGGALVNLAGEVIGINTAIATSGGSEQGGNIGVGFAISSNRVKSAADQLLKGGKVSHPYLGVQLTDGDNGGALIADVVNGGPADKAGLQKGDVVKTAAGQNVADANGLINVVQAHKTGDQVPMTIDRNGTSQQVTVTLGDTP